MEDRKIILRRYYLKHREELLKKTNARKARIRQELRESAKSDAELDRQAAVWLDARV